MLRSTVLVTTTFVLSAGSALAGGGPFPDPVPLPIAGAAGPVGLGVALAGYVGYRLFRKKD